MIKLIRGDIDSLEGRVTVFSRMIDEENPVIFALYQTTDALDFVERVGAPREVADKMKEMVDHAHKTLKEKGADFGRILPIFASPLRIGDEKDLYIGSEDLVDTGKFVHHPHGFNAVMAVSDIYFSKFTEQMVKRHNLDEINELEKGFVVEKSFRDVDRKEIGSYMTFNFVVPLLDSYIYDRADESKRIKSRFVRFGQESPFFRDILGLIEVIDAGKGKANYGLVEAYVGKIQAISSEDYVAAARFRDTIKTLAGK